ncbi:hypothetical protein JTE90_014011 [Oedothorax gibbosus]|uniref:Exophilin 5 n=1 Tax=Oedothorax gibbosus TaxID=931172 RepID=A0AAV6U5D8_9ARAC|nr:hypothetical protein JTE90_014011 [Oedothorax gibbosus]
MKYPSLGGEAIPVVIEPSITFQTGAVSTLSGSQESSVPFRSSYVDEESPIFSTIPRPSSVVRLRQLASGPSPPAFIPSTMIADDHRSSSSATHIYCQPLDQSNNVMSSTMKVPSTVVPIDVSGKSFSRMASFRRSFIHVDFFTRRKKKKDKRRNTVTEGNMKELKDALHNIINTETSQYPKEMNTKSEKNSNCGNNHNLQQAESSKINIIVNKETNNNSSDETSTPKSKNCFPSDTNSEQKNKINGFKNESDKLELKNHYNSEITKLSSFSKRKTKGRIPISTVSAAMSVAVEMRQLNGNTKSEDQSSSGNWSYSSDPNSSDSDNRRNSAENNVKELVSELDSVNSSLSKENLQNRLQEVDTKCNITNSKGTNESHVESSSYASSETNGMTDDGTSNATSADSEVFFISSDESDEDISDLIFETNYGSSVSITTVSNGSLNSLLSQTATEIASSTGTLTSIGLDRLPTPPPPPPIMITALANKQFMTTVDKDIIVNNLPFKTKKNSPVKHSSKKESNSTSQKNSKPLKSEKLKTCSETMKSSSENSKNIFNSLVSIKTRSKDRNKLKTSEKINKPISPTPVINMYGCDSPQIIKQLPLFIKETTTSPIIKHVPKSCMQSFSSNSLKHEPRILVDNKPNFTPLEPKPETKLNTPENNTSRNSTSCNSERDVKVPLKYTHRVVVTPIPRELFNEQSNYVISCRKALFKEDEQNMLKPKQGLKQIETFNTFHNEQHNFERSKPVRPTTLQPDKTKSAARVLLDPEGRVVQCTNSLDRKLHCVPTPEIHNYTSNVNSYVDYKKKLVVANDSDVSNRTCNQSQNIQSQLNSYQFNNDIMNKRYNNPNTTMPTMYKPDNFKLIEKDNLISHQNYKENYYPQVQRNFSITGSTASVQKSYCVQSPRQNLPIPRTPIIFTPDPNISGLPLNDNLLTQHNVKIHSKEIEECNVPAKLTTIDCKQFLTSSPRSLNSSISTEINKSPTTMSTEDLFAVIHNCKKKMNIKTDSDLSLASSSRSSSPSYPRPASAKSTLAETGFLSPRNLPGFDSRDRRSWADFRPSQETCSKRRSLASDRLGPTKPTSMHDFKMLLLQTRSNSQILGPKKSAVEMLKVSPCDKNTLNSPSPSSLAPQNSFSHSVPNSPSSEYFLCNGHSTVPFKRNNRTRSTLQPRYTMYPPIFEDCLEDLENNHNFQQNSENYMDGCKNAFIQQNESTLKEESLQNLSHWV